MRGLTGRIVVVMLVPVWAVACGGAAAGGAASKPQPAPVRPIVAVAGIDVSRSYNMAEQGEAMLADRVQHELRPGDTLFVRFIQTHSYDESAGFLTVRLPLVPPMPGNPYDRAGRTRVQQARQRVEALRSAAVRRLTEFRVANVSDAERSWTDIYGFLAKAAELLSNAPADAEKQVSLATDLIDSRRQRVGKLSLSGARVVIFYFQNGADVNEARKRKAFWTDELTRFGASEVVFMDPSQGAGDGLFRQTAGRTE